MTGTVDPMVTTTIDRIMTEIELINLQLDDLDNRIAAMERKVLLLPLASAPKPLPKPVEVSTSLSWADERSVSAFFRAATMSSVSPSQTRSASRSPTLLYLSSLLYTRSSLTHLRRSLKSWSVLRIGPLLFPWTTGSHGIQEGE
jgi:hypothetical protein